MEKAIKNITSERIIIGIILNHPDWLIQLNGLIRAEYFFSESHKMIFYIVYLLTQEGVTNIDTMAILARAERIVDAVQLITKSGGMVYLEEIKELAAHYSLEDLKRYAEEVTNCAYKRAKIDMIDHISDYIAVSPNLSIGDIELYSQVKEQELINKFSSAQQVKTMKDTFDTAWQNIENQRNPDGTVGLPSKIKMVNRYFTYRKSELIVIGARPKYGKSNWAINEVHNLSVVNGIPTGYFDTEMKLELFLTRIVALDSGVPIDDILSGVYMNNIDQLMAVEASKERVKNAPIYHLYDYAWDKAKVQHKAKLLKVKNDIQLLVHDYVKVKEVQGNTKETNELGNWTIMLKDLAGELDIPILTFAQLSPYERRLADSDKINRYASTIAYLLPKTNEEITRDFGAENGGTDFLYVDYNRIGAEMPDESKGINLQYTRYLSKFEQAKYQILDETHM